MSVDELVSSFSSNHIGQEAIDLAALQAQLAQALFGQSPPQHSRPQHVARKSSYTQPCNTPTAPSPSFSFGQMVDAQYRNTATEINPNAEMSMQMNDSMEEDEQIVEAHLLSSSSPMSANSASSQFLTSSPRSISQHPSYMTTEPPSSSFTTTDPFYVAQAQAAQNYPQSPFSQYGHPSQQSPFMIKQQSPSQYNDSFNCHTAPPHLSLDTHTLFMATAATFNP